MTSDEVQFFTKERSKYFFIRQEQYAAIQLLKLSRSKIVLFRIYLKYGFFFFPKSDDYIKSLKFTLNKTIDGFYKDEDDKFKRESTRLKKLGQSILSPYLIKKYPGVGLYPNKNLSSDKKSLSVWIIIGKEVGNKITPFIRFKMTAHDHGIFCSNFEFGEKPYTQLSIKRKRDEE